MNKNLESAQYRFIEGISRIGDEFGLNRSVIQLYLFLYLASKPLSLDEITEALGVSKGNVSINIRELERWGAVRSVWVKGSRKDYYEAEPDIKKVLANKLKSAIEKRLSTLSSLMSDFNKIIDSTNGDLTEEEKIAAKVYEEKLKKIEEMRGLASNALGIIGKFI